MTNQLFHHDGPHALSHATDPDTSRLAAEKVEASGSAESHRQQAMLAVRNFPGSTSAELAEYVGMERHEMARRLPELRTAGQVENGPKRRCQTTGNFGVTWYLKNNAPSDLSRLRELYDLLKRDAKSENPFAFVDSTLTHAAVELDDAGIGVELLKLARQARRMERTAENYQTLLAGVADIGRAIPPSTTKGKAA